MADITGIKNKYKRRLLLCITIVPLVVAASAMAAFTEVLREVPEAFINCWKGRE